MSKSLHEIAHHEAGHAVFHLKLGLGLGRVTIKPSRGMHGHVAAKPAKWMNDPALTAAEEQRQRTRAENEILSLFAGHIAEAKYAGREICSGHERDYAEILDLATSFISNWDRVHGPFLLYCLEKSTLLVEQWWPEIQALAHALVELETLRAREAWEVIAAIPLEVFAAHQERMREMWDKEQERLMAAYEKKSRSLEPA